MNVKTLNLPRICDPRGNLTFVESGVHLPFEIERVFYLYDVPGGADRGAHSLKTCWQFVVAISGSFDVVVSNAASTRTVRLDRPFFGLLIPPMVWRELNNFSSGAVCLVLASEKYDEDGYYRDWQEFIDAIGRQG